MQNEAFGRGCANGCGRWARCRVSSPRFCADMCRSREWPSETRCLKVPEGYRRRWILPTIATGYSTRRHQGAKPFLSRHALQAPPDLSLRLRADDAINFAAVAQHQKKRNTLYLEAGCRA